MSLSTALAQSNPSATTLTDVYTCPAGKRAVLRVIATNQGASGTYRVSMAINGAVDATEQYIAYDATLGANESVSSVPVSSTANFSFTVTGIEQTI
jgi:hypothetical protein